MTTTFETAKVGDRVWSAAQGCGKIIRIDDDSSYPIVVKFDSGGFNTFTFGGGYSLKAHAMQSLFWDEVVIEAPVKPMPDLPVDTKVLVWMDGSRNKYCRHFSHFENNNLYVFKKGLSSWTGHSTSVWDNWELAE